MGWRGELSTGFIASERHLLTAGEGGSEWAFLLDLEGTVLAVTMVAMVSGDGGMYPLTSLNIIRDPWM
jgi:hypothetical protein